MITIIGITVSILGAIGLIMSVYLVLNQVAFLRFVAVLCMVASALSIGVGYQLSVEGRVNDQCTETQ